MARKDYKVISALDLRYNFPVIRKNLARGQKFVILYRGQPIGELGPVTKEVADLFEL